MTFDKKHSWRAHIENLKVECKKRLNIINISFNSLESSFPGSTPYIQNKIDYGAVFYDSASNSLLKTLVRFIISPFD